MSPTESNRLPVSLIICSRNRATMLAATIDSVLQGQSVPAELLIVDQSSEPNLDLARRSEQNGDIRYLWIRSVGLSRAINIGAAAARHDLLVLTHDDVFVAPDWLGTLIQALIAHGPEAVVTGRVLASSEGRTGGYAPALKTEPEAAVYSDARGIGMLKPLNMGLYRSLFWQLGGFDVRLGPGTGFPGAEDSDLGFRVLKRGNPIVYVPEAVVYHRAWRREWDYLPLRWHYGVAQGGFYAKHFKWRDTWLTRHIAGDLRRRLGRFPRRMRVEPHRALGDPLFLLGNLAGAARWLLARRGPG